MPVLSRYVTWVCAYELLSDGAGAVGYLLKAGVGDVLEFVGAVCRVAAGAPVLDP